MDDDIEYTSADLLRLAQRCEAGARELQSEADNAAAVPATRAPSDQVDPQQWATTRRRAAQAAREYAEHLRAEAADPAARIDADRYEQAERVASAAQIGGILIDGRPQAERLAQTGSIWDRNAREHWEAGTTPAQIKAAQIEATGLFSHVADARVPYWQLGGNLAEQTSDRLAERTDHDGDGDEA